VSANQVAAGYRPGHHLTVTETGQRVVIWSAAPGPGAYWAHLLPSEQMVLVRVRRVHNATRPVVKIEEYR
jgi:hypothetical protein